MSAVLLEAAAGEGASSRRSLSSRSPQRRSTRLVRSSASTQYATVPPTAAYSTSWLSCCGDTAACLSLAPTCTWKTQIQVSWGAQQEWGRANTRTSATSPTGSWWHPTNGSTRLGVRAASRVNLPRKGSGGVACYAPSQRASLWLCGTTAVHWCWCRALGSSRRPLQFARRGLSRDHSTTRHRPHRKSAPPPPSPPASCWCWWRKQSQAFEVAARPGTKENCSQRHPARY
jgi:hypothetical protein